MTDPGGTPTQVAADGTFLLDGNQTGFRIDCDIEAIDAITKIVLIAPGSITHHSDMTARYMELSSVAESAGTRTFDLPDSRSLPRGYYMLFALNAAGIPSEAVWVKVR